MRKEQLEMALEVAVNYIKTDKANMSPGSPAHMCVTSVLKRIDDILHPAPAYEEMPVERWESKNPKGFYEWTTFPADAKDWEKEGRHVIKLTGVDRRPLPRPVERSVTGQFQFNGEFRSSSEEKTAHYGKFCTVTWVEEGK